MYLHAMALMVLRPPKTENSEEKSFYTGLAEKYCQKRSLACNELKIDSVQVSYLEVYNRPR